MPQAIGAGTGASFTGAIELKCGKSALLPATPSSRSRG